MNNVDVISDELNVKASAPAGFRHRGCLAYGQAVPQATWTEIRQ